MSVLRRIIRKKNGAKETVHLGALAKNVTQDATHRFVSDTEKQTWNGKANPGDIPSGAAADYGVANNDTTNRSDMLVTAQVAYQHGKEIDQLNSDLGGLSFGQDAEGNWGYKPSGADAVIPFRGDWELVLKITFGAAANNAGGTYTNDDAATDTPVGWYSSMNSTVRCVDGQITITGKCACAGRFSNQNNVAGYISNITVVSFSYL